MVRVVVVVRLLEGEAGHVAQVRHALQSPVLFAHGPLGPLHGALAAVDALDPVAVVVHRQADAAEGEVVAGPEPAAFRQLLKRLLDLRLLLPDFFEERCVESG